MDPVRRRRFVVLAALAPLAPVPALAAPLVVDLDVPGALARLKGDQPARYERVMALLRDAQRLPEKQVEGWIRTRYDADAVQLGQMLLVSYPPKRRLSFSLEKTAYVATIVVALPKPRIVPAR
jgi:hypothetical protein